jgi:ABC-2 type transport system permease protein
MLRLASFEWRLLRADATLRIFAVILTLLTGYGVYNGRQWVRFQEGTIARVLDEEASRFALHRADVMRAANGDTARAIQFWASPAATSRAGTTLLTRYAILPPAALGAFAVGQSDLYPYYTRVSTRTKQTFMVNDEIENPVNLMAGRFDLAFVTIYLLPLLILALSYNVVSAEREQGTLDLTLSQPVDGRRVILTKLLVRAVIVLGAVLTLQVIGAFASGTEVSDPGALQRLEMWGVVVMLYAAFWFALGLVVNAYGRSSATNAVILLTAWLAVVVVVPSLYNGIITTTHPSPSRVELTTALRAATNEANEKGTVLLQKYYLDHPEMMGGGDADMNDFAARSIAVQEAVEEEMGPALADFDRRLLAQQQLTDRFRYVSPALAVQAALFDLSGTSVHRYQAYQEQLDAFHRSWREWFIPRVFAKSRMQPEDVEGLPQFRFTEELAGVVAARVFPTLLGLLLPTVLLALVATTRMRGAVLRRAV